MQKTNENEITDSENELFIGRNAVTELLKSGRTVDRIFVSRQGDSLLAKIKASARRKGVPVIETDTRKLDTMSGHSVHQGVIAVASATDYLTAEALFELTESRGEKPFYIICDSINDPHNLGAIIRSACCAGANGIIIPKRHSASVNGTVAKASAGTVFSMPIARVSNLVSAIRFLKEKGVWIWALDADGKPYYEQDFRGACALVLGNEGDGVSELIRKESDFTAGIPMYGTVDSLNVSAAGAIVMFEAARQRNS